MELKKYRSDPDNVKGFVCYFFYNVKSDKYNKHIRQMYVSPMYEM